MKSILVIGIGRFGKHLCQDLVENGNDVMAVDEQEENLEEILPIVTSAKIGDCTKEDVLRSFGVSNFDICFVCIGTNFQSSLEVTNLLKEMGAKYVISKATRDIQAKFLLKNGADEVVYPDRDIAKRMATRVSTSHVYDYVEMGQYSIYEIQPLDEWIGKTVREVDFRAKYNVSIMGTKRGEETSLMLTPEHIFDKEEHLMVIGKKEDIDRILKQL